MKLIIYKKGYHFSIYKESKANLLFEGKKRESFGEIPSLLISDPAGTLSLMSFGVHSGSLWKFTPDKYELRIPANAGQGLYIECIHKMHQHWRITGGQDVYDCYTHNGTLRSFFKNGKQVAASDKESLVWFGRQTFYMHMDANADALLLTGFYLTLETRFRSSFFELKSDVGAFVGFNARKFDTSWRPL